jgi:hypothetical protein
MSELVYGKDFISNKNPNPTPIIKNVHFGVVRQIVNDRNDGSIRVYIDQVDESIKSDDNLPICYPLMSRIIHAMPKVGEIVLIIMGISLENFKEQKRGNRYWIGPVIENYEDIKDNNKAGPARPRNLSFDPINVDSKNNKDLEKDIYPIDDLNKDDIVIVGRDNTDINQSPNKITLRAGKHKKDNPREKNIKNPTYSVLEFIDENNSYSLTAGDEIYLISHKGRAKFKKVLTKDDLNEIKQNNQNGLQLQSMLYGELTVDYLKILTQAFLLHTHSHPQKEPIKKEVVIALEKKLNQIQDLLAKNIKIN